MIIIIINSVIVINRRMVKFELVYVE